MKKVARQLFISIFARRADYKTTSDMKIDEGFSVEISSGYDRLWKYNLAVTCGCFGSSGEGGSEDERLDFVAAEAFVAPVGSNLKSCPADYPADRAIRFTTVPCDYLKMYVYVIPHTLPEERDVADCKPFGLRVRVLRGKAVIHDEEHSVNCWSGASIELRLPKEQ